MYWTVYLVNKLNTLKYIEMLLYCIKHVL